MSLKNFIFTSESVTEGHPDKICDQISDAFLDEFISQDPNSRVAVETMVTTNFVTVAGEVTSKAKFDKADQELLVRKVIREIGYDDPELKFDDRSSEVALRLDSQSPDISQGVTPTADKEQGAGDQGLMFGYATSETAELMPSPILYAHKLTKKLSDKRKDGTLSFLKPDGKSQVTFRYENKQPVEIDAIVVSSQHSEDVSNDTIYEGIYEEVIKNTIESSLITANTKILINPTGRFVIGGPAGDAGLTGRKIIIDTYGGWARHGGGAFSGKDPSKVDRSAAYMARYVAKNIVTSGLASECEVQLAYAIGVADPVSVMVDTFGTGKEPEEKISEAIKEIFNLKPEGIIEVLDLLKPIYKHTASYGHFGKENENYTWEKTDKVEQLKRAI